MLRYKLLPKEGRFKRGLPITISCPICVVIVKIKVVSMCLVVVLKLIMMWGMEEIDANFQKAFLVLLRMRIELKFGFDF